MGSPSPQEPLHEELPPRSEKAAEAACQEAWMGFGRVAGYGARWIWKWIGVDMDGPMGGYKTTLPNQLAILTDHPSVSLYDIHERQVPCKSSLVYVWVWFRLHGWHNSPFQIQVVETQKPAGLSPRWSAIPTWRNPSRWWLSLTQQDEQGGCVFIWWLCFHFCDKKTQALFTDPPTKITKVKQWQSFDLLLKALKTLRRSLF